MADDLGRRPADNNKARLVTGCHQTYAGHVTEQTDLPTTSTKPANSGKRPWNAGMAKLQKKMSADDPPKATVTPTATPAAPQGAPVAPIRPREVEASGEQASGMKASPMAKGVG